VDGEVAQLAALVISANHRLSQPDDPMGWFAQQRAFGSCGKISFHAVQTRRFRSTRKTPVAQTPSEWLGRLADSGVKRIVLNFVRQDDDAETGETLPDRIAAGFSGGGSLWTMSTQTTDGGALAWQPEWRAAFPDAQDGRIWSVDYIAKPAPPAPTGVGVVQAAKDLGAAVTAIRSFAQAHQFENVAAIFASALCLLEGRPDPRPYPRPPGPADTLNEDARRLLYAAQRAWVFDNMGLWKDQDFSHDLWKQYARLSEALYEAVTAAMVAAVNASVSGAR